MLVSTRALSHLDVCVSSYPSVGYVHFIVIHNQTSKGKTSFLLFSLFLLLICPSCQSSFSGPEQIGEIKTERAFMILEHYRSLAVSSAQDTSFWWRRISSWQSWGFEPCCRLSRGRRAPSKLDKVIKMSVEDVILYLTLRRPARSPLNRDRLQSQTAAVPWLALLREHGWQILQWHGSRTHTLTNTCTQSYYVTPALRRVWHMLMRQALPVAGSAALSSTAAHHYRNQSHFHLHHLSSSHWWREGVAIIFSPTQSGEITNVSLSHARGKKKKSLLCTNPNIDCGTWHM